VVRGGCSKLGHEVSAADAEIMAMYGELDDARKQQILDYQQELVEAELAKQHAQGSPRA
jgi:hypothetical protein